jgi:hypothetical protein
MKIIKKLALILCPLRNQHGTLEKVWDLESNADLNSHLVLFLRGCFGFF